ncbi:MAG: hypothetical protein J3K34DRAFT_113160 [Monoraphidium minutum]|nr:MAG: hypothetical protein J3K34DRAFT_113160 [Monoraphidium minutum]
MSTAKGERLKLLQQSRQLLYSLPCDKPFELPGRPNVCYMIRNYSVDPAKGVADARAEAGFMFKAFETGQIGPRRLARMVGEDAPRNATIHEYLDWTVTALEAKDETEYDFSGFRVLLLFPRERNLWPAPNASRPEPRADGRLGAPSDPWPGLLVRSRPLTAATIRAGPGYLEVPFVATHENKRGRGFGRCVVEAVEDVGRALGIGALLLCSTVEEHVRATWSHLGFVETTDADLEALDVQDTDLIHMQNTLQMWKSIPPPRRWRAVKIKHEAFVARTYAPLGRPGPGGRDPGSAFLLGMTHSHAGGANGAASSYRTASSGGGYGGGYDGGCDDGDGDGSSYPQKAKRAAVGDGPRPAAGQTPPPPPPPLQPQPQATNGLPAGGQQPEQPQAEPQQQQAQQQIQPQQQQPPQQQQQQQQPQQLHLHPPQARPPLLQQQSEALSDVLVFAGGASVVSHVSTVAEAMQVG